MLVCEVTNQNFLFVLQRPFVPIICQYIAAGDGALCGVQCLYDGKCALRQACLRMCKNKLLILICFADIYTFAIFVGKSY